MRLLESAFMADSKRQNIIIACVLAIFAIAFFIVYSVYVGGEFLWDEVLFIYFSPLINPDNKPVIKYIFPPESYFRPIRVAFFYLISRTFEVEAVYFRVPLVILGAINIFLVYFFTLKLFKNKLHAVLATCFFAFCPSNIEVFTAATGFDDACVAAFSLSGFIFYIFYTEKSKIQYLILSLLSFVLVCFSKETGFVAILFPLVYELFKGGFPTVKKKIPVLCLFMLPLILYLLLRDVSPEYDFWKHTLRNLENHNFMIIVVTWFKAILIYAFHAIIFEFPEPTLYYFTDFLKFNDPIFLLVMILAPISILGIYRKARKNKEGLLIITMFFLSMLPVSNILRIPVPFRVDAFIMGNRFFYFPSIFFMIMLSLFATDVFKHFWKKKKARFVNVVLLLFLSLLQFYNIYRIYSFGYQFNTFQDLIDNTRRAMDRDSSKARGLCNLNVIADMEVVMYMYKANAAEALRSHKKIFKYRKKYCRKK